MTQPSTTDAPFAEWAIIELLGHRRLAGHIQEVQIAGHGFLRLDIPAAGDDPARTQLIAPAAVYAMHPVGEATARRAAQAWRPEPVSRWELPALEPADKPTTGWDGDVYAEDLKDDDERGGRAA